MGGSGKVVLESTKGSGGCAGTPVKGVVVAWVSEEGGGCCGRSLGALLREVASGLK